LVVPAVCIALSLIELQGAFAPTAGKTVIDGEIVCLDKRGRPQFNDLLFHRGEPCFFAFDLLM
jgi:ATP-dependent DNA ligase